MEINKPTLRNIEYIKNKQKTLMVHSFKSLLNLLAHDGVSELTLEDLIQVPKVSGDKKNLKIELKESVLKLLENYLITFDDGLYQQIDLIKLFPPEKVIFFPSFGLLRPPEMDPIPIENSYAHKHKNTSLSTFMTSTEVWNLMRSGYKLGMHGWYHLNLNLNQNISSIKTKESRKPSILLDIKEDAQKCAKAYVDFLLPYLYDYVVDDTLTIYFCTPYNCYNDYQLLYIRILIEYLNIYLPTNITKIKLIIFSGERESIENFIKDNTNAII